MNAIEKLEAQVKDLKERGISAVLPKSSGWFSRKLITLLVIAGIVVFLGRENINTVIIVLAWLGLGYMFTQSVVDAVKEWQAGATARADIQAKAEIEIAKIQYPQK